MRRTALIAMILVAACGQDRERQRPGNAEAGAGPDVPLCDVSALPGALDDQRCMERLTSSNLRYKHGVLGARLEQMDGPAVRDLRARHTAWSLGFEADASERALAALELYELAIEMAILERGGPRSNASPDRDGGPAGDGAGTAGPAQAGAGSGAESTAGSEGDDLGVAPIPDAPPPPEDGKPEPKSVQEYRRRYTRVGAALKKAKLGKADRLVLAYKSLDFAAGLKSAKIRQSFIATLKTIERQLEARQ